MTYKIKGEAVIDSLGNIVYTENDIIANTSLTFKSGPPVFQGTVAGYTSGGYSPSKNTIDKFAFATDGNATDVGDLTSNRHKLSGQSSSENGYVSGGTYAPTAIIDKFPLQLMLMQQLLGY
jgi:hypothetical protein